LNFEVYSKDMVARMLVEHIKYTHSAEVNLQSPNGKKWLYRTYPSNCLIVWMIVLVYQFLLRLNGLDGM